MLLFTILCCLLLDFEENLHIRNYHTICFATSLTFDSIFPCLKSRLHCNSLTCSSPAKTFSGAVLPTISAYFDVWLMLKDDMQSLSQNPSAELRAIKVKVDTFMAQGYYRLAFDAFAGVHVDPCGPQNQKSVPPLEAAMHIYRCLLETIVKASSTEPLEITKQVLDTMTANCLDYVSIEDAVRTHCPIPTIILT